MIEQRITRDIYLRAHTELHREKPITRKQKRVEKPKPDRWPERALIFDTETRTIMEENGYQQLTIGCFRICVLVEGEYRCEREGIVYSGEEIEAQSNNFAVLDKSELNAIGTFTLNNLADIEVKGFIPMTRTRLEIYQSFPQFMKKVFFPALRKGCLIVGFNLPFDLSRLSLGWTRYRGERGFSLIMSKWFDPRDQRWKPNGFRPTIHIEPKDSRTAFISRSSVRKRAKAEWPHEGRFLDLYTLLYSFFDKHMGLDAWCEYFRDKGYAIDRKLDHEPEGIVTQSELRYCRRDVKVTHHLLNCAMREFNVHPLPSVLPDKSYSPAVIAKGYMREMGIELPMKKFASTLTPEINGIAMQAYYGGRSECHIRRVPVPVMRLDFTSCYCTVNTLLKLWDVLTAASIEFPDCTQEVRDFLNTITLDDCFKPETWPQLRFFALVQPDHDIFPVRTNYVEKNRDRLNIGLNYVTSEQPIWFSGPDIIASILLNGGKVPKILKAIRVVPSEKKQEGLKLVKLLGKVDCDPRTQDFYKLTVEQKQLLKKTDEPASKGMKCIGNAGAYGPLVQLNESSVQFYRKNKKKEKIRLYPELDVWSGTHHHRQPLRGDKQLGIQALKEIETPGPFYFPPAASLITSGSRLLLALAQALVENAGGKILFCDTDSLCVVANNSGKPVKVSWKDDVVNPASHEFDPIPTLTREQVIGISERFTSLNPYNHDIVRGTILKVEDVNFVPDEKGKPTKEFRKFYGYAISAKRYVLGEGSQFSEIVDAKAHGIGYLSSPVARDKDEDRFAEQFWRQVLKNEGVSFKSENPDWLDYPAMMKVPITSPTVLERFNGHLKPYDFAMSPVVRAKDIYQEDVFEQAEKPLLVTYFTKHAEDWLEQTYFDTKRKSDNECRITLGESRSKNVVPVLSYRNVVNQYVLNAESKFNGPDGHQCLWFTRGMLQRAHVIARSHKPCGKEVKRKLEQGVIPLMNENGQLDFTGDSFDTRIYGDGMVALGTAMREKLSKFTLNEIQREAGIWRDVVCTARNGEKITAAAYAKFLRFLAEQEKKQIPKPKRVRRCKNLREYQAFVKHLERERTPMSVIVSADNQNHGDRDMTIGVKFRPKNDD